MARGLTRRLDRIVTVDNLYLDIEEGIFGVLGPNGEGKTTTISMLTTMLRPTFGTASIAGFDVIEKPSDVRRVIGMVFQKQSPDGLLTGEEDLEMHHASIVSLPL